MQIFDKWAFSPRYWARLMALKASVVPNVSFRSKRSFLPRISSRSLKQSVLLKAIALYNEAMYLFISIMADNGPKKLSLSFDIILARSVMSGMFKQVTMSHKMIWTHKYIFQPSRWKYFLTTSLDAEFSRRFDKRSLYPLREAYSKQLISPILRWTVTWWPFCRSLS